MPPIPIQPARQVERLLLPLPTQTTTNVVGNIDEHRWKWKSAGGRHPGVIASVGGREIFLARREERGVRTKIPRGTSNSCGSGRRNFRRFGQNYHKSQERL